MKREQATSGLEARLGVQFRDLDLLLQALTHSSYANEHDGKSPLGDNERLEFLGDAVLDLVVAEMLYQRYPASSEGSLTQLRASLVNTQALAGLAKHFHLGEYLRIGHGEEISGGRARLSTLCCTFEAVIGALYLDSGLDAVERVVLPPMQELLVDILARQSHIDFRGELQDIVHARRQVSPAYAVLSAAGPEHAKEFHAQVSAGGAVLASGRGKTIRAAYRAAARAALQALELDPSLWDRIKTAAAAAKT